MTGGSLEGEAANGHRRLHVGAPRQGRGDRKPFSSPFQDLISSSRKWVMLMMAPVTGTNGVLLIVSLVTELSGDRETGCDSGEHPQDTQSLVLSLQISESEPMSCGRSHS